MRKVFVMASGKLNFAESERPINGRLLPFTVSDDGVIDIPVEEYDADLLQVGEWELLRARRRMSDLRKHVGKMRVLYKKGMNPTEDTIRDGIVNKTLNVKLKNR